MGERDELEFIGAAPRDAKTFELQLLATVLAMRGVPVVFVNPKPTSP